MSGKGKYVWVDGAVYEGDFLRNKRDGQGILKYGNSSKINIEYFG